MHFCPVCGAAYRNALTHCPRDQAELTTGRDPLIGSVVAGRYRVVGQLGRGGMGIVYEAEHTEFGKTFALKVLFGDLAANDKMLARFRREAQAASLLKHIHIVSVTDFGATDKGLAYLAMERLQGRSLSQAIRDEGPFSVRRAMHIGRQIGSALAHAHDKGVLHRDLKPENVMLEDREEGADFVSVLDFGLARLVQSKSQEPKESLTVIGTVQGTPEFMSPEQAQGLTLGPASDLYALGLLLYCMLSQELPFELPAKRTDMLALHAFEPPRPLSTLIPVPKRVEALVMKLLEKDPERRYPNGREVCFAIDDVLAALDRERPKHNSMVDTWDEAVHQTVSDADDVGLTLSEGLDPDQLKPDDVVDTSSTVRMSQVDLNSVLEMRQTADSALQQRESAPGYVVVESGPTSYRGSREPAPEPDRSALTPKLIDPNAQTADALPVVEDELAKTTLDIRPNLPLTRPEPRQKASSQSATQDFRAPARQAPGPRWPLLALLGAVLLVAAYVLLAGR